MPKEPLIHFKESPYRSGLLCGQRAGTKTRYTRSAKDTTCPRCRQKLTIAQTHNRRL